MSYSQYGLTAVDASGADHDKGIVAAPDGKFYQIDGFKRNQKDGLDEDKGAALMASLKLTQLLLVGIQAPSTLLPT